MLEPYHSLHSQLISEGTVFLPQEDLPLKAKDWERLNEILDNSLYEKIEQGDTYEDTSVSVYRIKKAGNQEVLNKEIMEIVNLPTLQAKLSSIMGVKHYSIDRCQSNMYYEGDFVSKHKDSESCKDHLYAFMLFPSTEFEGGEFCVYNPQRLQPYAYKPEPNSLILTRCDLTHEVKPVTKGVRRAIVSFLQVH